MISVFDVGNASSIVHLLTNGTRIIQHERQFEPKIQKKVRNTPKETYSDPFRKLLSLLSLILFLSYNWTYHFVAANIIIYSLLSLECKDELETWPFERKLSKHSIHINIYFVLILPHVHTINDYLLFVESPLQILRFDRMTFISQYRKSVLSQWKMYIYVHHYRYNNHHCCWPNAFLNENKV